MPSVSKNRWDSFVDSLRLRKRLEFNAGDIGISGGIQMRESAHLNPTTIDMIHRYGGSTSPEYPWPADEADGDGDDRFDRIEKALHRLAKTAGRSRHGSGGTGTGTASKSSSGASE